MRKITMKSTSENGGSVRDKSEDRATNFSDQDDDNKHDATEKDANKSFDTDKSFVDSENEKQSDLDNDNDSDANDTQIGKSKSKKSPKKRTKKVAGSAVVNGKAGGKKKPKKKKTAERKSNAAEDETEEEYEVEKVVNKKKIGSKTYYLIRWKGYSASSDSWEEEDTLNCDALIKEYLEKAKKETPTSKKRGTEAPRRTQRVDYTEDEEEEEYYTGYSSSSRKRKLPGEKPSPRGKRARKDESEDDEPPEEYEVEKILKVQNTKKGREFLVRWKGYPESQATWEPEKNLNCRDLLDRFMEKQKENHSPAKNKKTASPKSKKKAAKSPKSRGGRAKAR